MIGLGGPAVIPFNCITGLEPAELDHCAEIGGYSEGVNYRIAASAHAREMCVVDDRHYADIIPFLSDERYVQYCEETDIPFGCQIALQSETDALVGLAVLKARRDGQTTPNQRAVFEAAAPYVRAAVRTQIALRSEGATLLTGAMDAVSARVLLCDGFGRICAVTPTADQLLSKSNRLNISMGSLQSCIGFETSRITNALVRVLEGRAIEGVDIVLPPFTGISDEIRVSIRSLPVLAWDFGHAPRAVITLTCRDPLQSSEMTEIAVRFGLTKAEAEVAVALAHGRDRTGIAERRGVSTDTVKAQLKAIFLKMDVNREADVVRILRQSR